MIVEIDSIELKRIVANHLIKNSVLQVDQANNIAEQIKLIVEDNCVVCKDNLDDPIESLDISARLYVFLYRSGIITIQDLTNMTHTQLLGIRNIGTKSVNEIIKSLDKRGLKLRENIIK